MFFANLPFPVGSTYAGGATVASTDGAYLEGSEYYVPDFNSGSNPKLRSNRIRKLRVVRNAVTVGSGGDVTTGNLRPKRIVSIKAGQFGQQVDGYTATNPQRGYPVDEFLPSAGVIPNDLFYIVLEGPATVTHTLAQPVNITAETTIVVADTAATSGATTAGRVLAAVYTNLTSSQLAGQITNGLGVAMTGATSGNTAADLLIDVGTGII